MKKKKAGYTLAEILIGLVLLGVGLISVAGVYPFALAHIRIMGERVFVLQQAQSKMETIKSMNFNDLMEIATGCGFMEQSPLKDVSGQEFDKYKFRASFHPAEENLIKIKMEIYWTEENSHGKGLSNKSYIIEGYRTKIE